MSKPTNRFIAPTRKFGAGKSKDGLSIVILAGAIGHRMKSYGPKSLIRFSDGETILDKQVSTLTEAFPNSEIILVVGFEADRVIRNCPPHIRIIENQLYEETSSVEEARLGLNAIGYDNVLFINGDLIFNPETLVNATKNGSALIVDSKEQLDKDEVGVTVVGEAVTIFSHGLDTKWAQIAYLASPEIKLLKSVCSDRENRRLYLFEGLNQVLDKKGNFMAIEPLDMKIKKIDTPKAIN